MKKLSKVTAAVVGASGYAGSELVKILAKHHRVSITHAQSKSQAGAIVPGVDQKTGLHYSDPTIQELNRTDVVFLAVPKEEAVVLAPQLETAVVDLSPAHRFDPHFVYGFPEASQEHIASATKIANPGCYATACILGVLPIIGSEGVNFVAFDCKSGYSGGGKTKKYAYDENVVPYNLNAHYQEPEIAKFLKTGFSFAPHVVNAFRGLIATIHVIGKIQGLKKIYEAFYGKHPLVKVTEAPPDFASVRGTPFCQIGGFSEKEGHAMVVVAIDNLLKGAASQAVQNMNLMFGFHESEGVMNYEFMIHDGFEGLDKTKIRELIEKSFGKKLADDYFEHPAGKVIVEKNYRGIAIIKTVNGVPYLDKLAVTPELQGNGLAKAVMDELKEIYPCLIWRAKVDNPINPWYFKNSEGTVKSGKWTIFWYGMEPQQAYSLVADISSIPETLAAYTEAA